MKKGYIFLLGLIFLSTQVFTQEPPPKLYTDFQYAEVSGKVLDQNGQGVPDIKIRVFLLKDGKGVFGNVNAIQMANYSTEKLDLKSWANTDSEGYYVIKGIPYPGSYIMEIKGVEGYKNTQKFLRIDTGRGEKIENFNFVLDKFPYDKGVSDKLNTLYKYYYEGEYNKVKKLSETTLAQNDSVGEIYVILGNMYVKEKNAEKAILNYKKALELGEKNEGLLFNLAKLKFQMKDFEYVSEICENLIKKNSENSHYIYMAAMSYFNQQKYESAGKYFSMYNSSVDDSHKDAYFYYAFGMSRYYLDNYAEALTYLKQAESRGMTNNVELYKALVTSFIKVSDKKNALKIINITLERFPEFKGRDTFLKMKAQMK